jgi:hypothetical protein
MTVALLLKTGDTAIVKAVMDYRRDGTEPSDLAVWPSVREEEDRRSELSAKRSAAGRAGGFAKANSGKSWQKVGKSKQKLANDDITRAPASDGQSTDKLTPVEEKKNYVLYKEEPPSTPPEPPAETPSEPTDFALVAEPVAKPTPPAAKAKFKKPDVFEVAAYCRERQNGVDAQAFVDFYESKGWMIGKNPMKDWKAAVRTWERQRNTPPSTADPTKFYNPEPTDWSKLGQTYGSSPITTPTPQTF